jgi:3-hydroxyacyl-CoA dehydrogenase / enoyl-CoA hydratase / 3-hydroxybutyryl-CoA epimerase
VVNDARGFYTTRVITAYIQEAFAMVGEGLPPALVDNAAKMAGYPIGPLAMMDDIGMDNGYKAALAERDAVGPDKWKPGAGFAVNESMVAKLGRRGRRVGAGFYDYEHDKRKPSLALAAIYPPPSALPVVEELKQRMLYAEALEAARAMEEGVLTDPAEGDVGAVLGIGFPGYTGGPFSLIDTTGLPTFVAACDALADRHGERFRPSAWLRERAQRNEPFHAAA